MEGEEMKTVDRGKQNPTASGQVPGKGKHLQAFAVETFEKVNSVCALKLRAQPVQHPIFNSYFFAFQRCPRLGRAWFGTKQTWNSSYDTWLHVNLDSFYSLHRLGTNCVQINYDITYMFSCSGCCKACKPLLSI